MRARCSWYVEGTLASRAFAIPRAVSLPCRGARTPAALPPAASIATSKSMAISASSAGPAPFPARRPRRCAAGDDAQGFRRPRITVYGQPVKPGAEGASPERSPTSARPGRKRPDDVVHVVVAQHPPGEARDPGQMPADRSVEGVRVPTGGQRRVYRVGRSCRVPGAPASLLQSLWGHCEGLDRVAAQKVAGWGGGRKARPSRARHPERSEGPDRPGSTSALPGPSLRSG